MPLDLRGYLRELGLPTRPELPSVDAREITLVDVVGNADEFVPYPIWGRIFGPFSQLGAVGNYPYFSMAVLAQGGILIEHLVAFVTGTTDQGIGVFFRSCVGGEGPASGFGEASMFAATDVQNNDDRVIAKAGGAVTGQGLISKIRVGSSSNAAWVATRAGSTRLSIPPFELRNFWLGAGAQMLLAGTETGVGVQLDGYVVFREYYEPRGGNVL